MYLRLFVALFRIAMACHANINIYPFWVLLLLVRHKDTVSLATASVWSPQWEETLSVIFKSPTSKIYDHLDFLVGNDIDETKHWKIYTDTSLHILLFIHKRTKSQEKLLISNSINFNQTTCTAYFHIYKKLFKQI